MTDTDVRIRLGLQTNTSDTVAIQREMAKVGQAIDLIFEGIFDGFDKRVADLATKTAAIGAAQSGGPGGQGAGGGSGGGGLLGLLRGTGGAPSAGATAAFADAASKATAMATAFVGVDRALASLTATLGAANTAAGQHVTALRASSSIERTYQRDYDHAYQDLGTRGSDRTSASGRPTEHRTAPAELAIATATAHGGILLGADGRPAAHTRTADETPLGTSREMAEVSRSLTTIFGEIFDTLETRLKALAAPGSLLAPTSASAPPAAAPPAATEPPAASTSSSGGLLAILGMRGGGGGGGGGSALGKIAGSLGTAAAMGAAFVGVDKSLTGLINTVSQANTAAAAHTIALGDLQKALSGTTGDFTAFRGQLLATGNMLGYSYDQIIAMTQTYGATGVRGETSGPRLARTVGGIEQFSSGYGQDPTQMASVFAGMVNQGYGLTSGQPRLAADIADAVSSGQMNGRMGDVVNELSTLTSQIENTTASTPDLSTLLSVMTTANASGIRGLQGTRGAQVLGTVGQNIQNMGNGSPVSQMAWYQALSQGGKLNLAQTQFRAEQGIAGPGNLKDVMTYAQKLYSGYSPDMQLYGESQFMGVSMHQMQALNQAFMKNGHFDDKGYGTLTAGLARYGTTPGQVNQQALPVLAQLFNGGSLSGARSLAATEGFTLPKGAGTMTRDQLIKAILGQTPQDLASKTRQGTQAVSKGAESIAQDLLPFVTKIKDAYGGLLSDIGTAEQGAKSLGDVIGRLVASLDKLVPPPSSVLPKDPIPAGNPFSFLNGPIDAGENLLDKVPPWLAALAVWKGGAAVKGATRAAGAIRGKGKGPSDTSKGTAETPEEAMARKAAALRDDTGTPDETAGGPPPPAAPRPADTVTPEQALKKALKDRATAEADAAAMARKTAESQDAAGAQLRIAARQEALAGTRTAQMGAEAELAKAALADVTKAGTDSAPILRYLSSQAKLLGDADASGATHQEAANVATTEEGKMAAAQAAQRMTKLAKTEKDPRLKEQYEKTAKRLNDMAQDPATDIPDLSPAVVAAQLYMQGVGALHDSSVQGGKAIAQAQNARLTGKYAGVFAEAQAATGIPMATTEGAIESASGWNPKTAGGVSGMSAADIALVNKTFGETWTPQQLQGSPAASILAEAEYLQMMQARMPHAGQTPGKPLPKPGTVGKLSRTPFQTTALGQAGAPPGTTIWDYEGGSLMQGFHPGPGALEPNHPGIDVGLPGGSPVKLPQSGRYMQAESSPYRSEFQLANGNYEVLLHLKDAAKYKNGQLIAAGTQIGQVDPTVHTAADKYRVQEYGGAWGGPYISEGSHVHIAEYGARHAAQAQFDQNAGALNPNQLFGAATGPGGGATGPGGGDGVPAYVPAAYRDMIAQAAAANNYPAALLAAQVQQESGFQPGVVNSIGAAGIGQIMPATAAAWGVNPLDPRASINAMASHDEAAFKKYGTYQDALAAYNAGGGAVDQYGGVPPYAETQQYVAAIMQRYQTPGPLASAPAGHGGGALSVAVAPIVITLKSPDGKTQKTTATARAVYQGVKPTSQAAGAPFVPPSPFSRGYLTAGLTAPGGR